MCSEADDLSFEDESRIIIGFNLAHKVKFGQSVYVSGDLEFLGNWDTAKSIRMSWTPQDVWTCRLIIKGYNKDLKFKYKYFVSDSSMNNTSAICWETGPNRNFSSNTEYKFIQHLDDVWSSIKILFKFSTEEKVHEVVIIGDVEVLGYHADNPGKMYLRYGRNAKNLPTMQYWERELIIPAEKETVNYRYGIRERKNSSIKWERDGGRVFFLKDLKYYTDGHLDQFLELHGIKPSFQTSFAYKNSSFFRMDQHFKHHFVFSELSDLFWVGPYPEEEQIGKLQAKGCQVLISLLQPHEAHYNQPSKESYQEECLKNGLEFINLAVGTDLKSSSEELLKATFLVNQNHHQNKLVYLFCDDEMTRSILVAFLFYHIYLNYPVKRSIDKVNCKRWNKSINEEMVNTVLKNISLDQKDRKIAIHSHS